HLGDFFPTRAGQIFVLLLEFLQTVRCQIYWLIVRHYHDAHLHEKHRQPTWRRSQNCVARVKQWPTLRVADTNTPHAGIAANTRSAGFPINYSSYVLGCKIQFLLSLCKVLLGAMMHNASAQISSQSITTDKLSANR